MATTIEREERRGTRADGRRTMGPGLTGLAILGLVAVAVAAAAFLTQGPAAPEAPRSLPAPIFTEDELEVYRLVEAGVLPGGVLDAEPFRTKALVASGQIPREALIPSTVPIRPPLYCPADLAVMQAVAAGVIPAEVLDGEPFRTKRLIAGGQIPWQAAEPC